MDKLDRCLRTCNTLLLTSMLALLLASSAVAQPTAWAWSTSHDNGTNEYVAAVATAPDGLHHYVAGTYDFWALLGNGPFGLPNTQGLTGSSDGFLVKLDQNGDVVWRNRIGGTGTDYVTGMTVGPDGNIYVTGAFSGSFSLLGFLGLSQSLSSSGGTDMFVACFSPYGDLIWMQKGGGAQNDEGYSVAVDATGVYVHGTYRTTATFGTSTLTSGNNTRNAFLVKFPLNGDAPLWVYKGEASSSENVEPGGIVAGEGRIFVIGNFNSDQFRWRSATNTQLASVSTTGTVGNVYVSAFDQSGSTAWLRAIDDPGDNNRSTAIDLSCRKLYIGGRCHQNAVFPGSVAMQHTSAHDFMYVAVLNASSGSTQRVWTARGSSNHQAEVRTIKASENGHVHFTAWFRGTLQTMEGVQYTATNGTDMVVGRLDREGRLQWLRHDGAQGDELPYALDVDQSNRLFVAGAYTDRLSQPPYTHAASTNLNIFHSALDDPAPSVDPSRWKPVQAVCATAGLIDLNERIRGYADATRSTSGVLQATDMIGAPDGAGALFSTTTANVIIDLGDTVPAGYPISFLWAATTAAAVNARIEYATTVGSWTTHPGTLNRNSLSYGTSSIHLNAPARFIRISRSTAPSSGPFRIDAVSFYTSTLPGGTWTGPNVNATGQFDPAGFSGHVNITYTVNDGSCSYTTTRTMLVTPPASALLSGTTDVCPGPLPVTVELSDLSAYTDLEDWEYTTNGMDWDGLGTDDQLLYFPDGISETTWFRAVLRSSGCGQAYSMEHRVQVGDTLPPIILNCPADTVLHLPVSSCTSPFVWPTVLSTDNCGTSAFTAGTLVLHYSDPFAQQSIDVTNAPMFNMPAGVHQLTESFSDDSGNTSTCSYTITVIDSIAPTIECPRDLFLEVDANTCGRVVSYPTPIFSDNCPGATITLLQGPASGSFFPVGSTRITHRVTDNSGNERMCSFWVTIIDTQAPTLANCTDIVVDIDPNTCGAAVTFSAPLFDDNCGPCSVAALPAGTIHLGEYQGRSYHLATTPHNWSSANNAAIAAGGHLAVIRNATHNTWLRNAVSVASPTAVGNERAYWVGLSDAAVEGSFRWINGTPATYLNWSVNEPSNTNGGEHYVEVLSSGEWNDLRMESLRRYVIEIEPSCSQVVQFSGPASGSVFPVGDTEVSFKVVDATGNASTCSFTVTVWDNTACGCANPAPGSACDDGDSATVNDLIQADCSCVGTLLDCAGVPDGDAVLDNCGTCVGGSTGLIACDQDCNNVWGGTASIDACGVCSGGNTGIAINSTCLDCNGDVNGTASIDACGVCSGGNTGIAINSTCLDCNGDVNGTASIDACGVCSGGNTGIAINSTCLDCNGDVNGTASIDACGVCSGGNTGISPNSTCLDCNGDVNGTASIDACGVCSGGNTGIAINSTCLDCNGDVNGTASIDACGVCSGGNTGIAINSTCLDCNGDVNGTASIDACGVCSGGNTGIAINSTCLDCNGAVNGTASIDACGVCSGGNTGIAINSTCLDCNGDVNGTASIDACGVCSGGNTGIAINSTCLDCNGDVNGTASIDACGVCSGGNTGIAINSTCLDCNGDVNGTASIDACGVCSGGNTGIAINSTCLDCNGDVNGTASIDACGVCSGGNTGIAINSTCLDCNGDVNGTASIDACGVCSGGNTGIAINSTCLDCNGDVNGTASIDACGVCSGGNTGIAINSTCLDCNGDVNGTASIDACGVCSGGITGIAINSTCLDCNGDVNGTASIDACGVCSGGNTGIAINSTCLDCNGDVNGTASIDACGVCSGGNTGISPNSTCLDCNGDVNGTASIDACGVCSGGNTGIAINSTCLDCNGDVNGTALPGTPCNDQNAATVNDTWDQNCNCVGVPINCSSYAGPDQVVCGNTTQLNASGFGIWEYPSGLNITDPSNAQSSVTANVLGTYDLFWVVEDGPCIAIDTVSVTFLPIPDASFQYAASVLCSASQPETPWVAMSGGVFTSNPTTLALDPFTGIIDAAASVPGTYEVTHSIAGTCPSNSSTTVVIVGSMDAAWNAPSSICSNDTPIQLASTVIGDQGGTWSGTGVTNSIFNPSGLAGAIELTYTVGTAPCAASQTHTITVNGAPSANAGPDLTTCGASISMQATAGNGHSTWSIPNGLSVVGALGDPNITIEADAPGSYTLSWTVTNGLCTATDQVTVTFLPMNSELWVEAGPDQYLAMVDNTVLIGSASPGASVTWSISSGAGHFTSPHSLQTTLHGLTPGQHTVILHANQGPCASASDTLIIHIADLFIPEGFSPNGDGVNDLYEITGIMALPGSRLTVFNRWGQEVYQSSDYRNEWDGRSAGRALPDDTYFYVLNLSNDRSYNGHIILKR